ncbi:MAG: alpha/beta hydrolase [Burkholderiaceae bacterium]|nr:alpha/beta hydrolase [Burkholderiaceae bacterium]
MGIHPGIGKTLWAAEHHTNYLEEGSGKPLILLHGSGPGVSAWTNWSEVMAPLAQQFRVVAPDIAGFGFTEFKAGSRYDMKLWVRHLLGTLDALGLEKVSLVGNSFGGALAIGLATFAPERVDKLVLLGTPAGEFEQTPGLRSACEYEPSLEAMERTMRLFPFDPAVITETMVRTRYEASARPGAQEALRQLIPPPNPEGPTVLKGFPESVLAKVQAPTLVLHGREDAVVPVACGWRLAHAIPRAEFHLFGQCGHWVQVEHRERFVQLVRDFCG